MRAALRRLLLLAVVACVAGPVELAHAGPMRTASLASNGRPDRIESFADGAGRQFLVGTDLPGVDLASFARILIGTIHGNELRRVQVLVAPRADIDSLCGEQAAACYFGADDGSGRGQINVAADDPSLRHSLIHEYGHHIDNQLVGIGKGISLNRLSCSVGGDGSRRWLFARERQSRVLTSGRFRCNPTTTPWDRLLPELFAEDYAYLNGIRDWQIPGVAPPDQGVLAALRADMRWPLRVRRRTWRGQLAGAGSQRLIKLRLTLPTLLGLKLVAPAQTRFELRLVRAGHLLSRSAGRGRKQVLRPVLESGSYLLIVRSLAGRGPFRVAIVER
ncbi:hypothetical protein [Thermoleophilum album]|uniref:Uncharacterized protein n=1 Tax=Thermoleophilum album TaxID=29539 RepID=A0A1H6FU37_THEAL|nr:hypothetical protein [Thermoleophilum album]SEH13688.1 hypothetical protein SAMN02745716_1263 [Thermoleophilum album]